MDVCVCARVCVCVFMYEYKARKLTKGWKWNSYQTLIAHEKQKDIKEWSIDTNFQEDCYS